MSAEHDFSRYSRPDVNALLSRVARVPTFGEYKFGPTELMDIGQMNLSVDSQGIAHCTGSDGDTTHLAAVLLGDIDYPVRVPFVHTPNEYNPLALRIHGDDTLALVVGDTGHVPEGIARGAVAQMRVDRSSGLLPIASRHEPGIGVVELPYRLAMPAARKNPIERDLGGVMGLFDERLGFDPENTRVISSFVAPPSERYPIPIIPGMQLRVATRNTVPNNKNIRPDMLSVQSLFNINVEQLLPSLPKQTR